MGFDPAQVLFGIPREWSKENNTDIILHLSIICIQIKMNIRVFKTTHTRTRTRTQRHCVSFLFAFVGLPESGAPSPSLVLGGPAKDSVHHLVAQLRTAAGAG